MCPAYIREFYPVKWASTGIPIVFKNFRRQIFYKRLNLSTHAKTNSHILACAQLVKKSDQYSKFENKTDEIDAVFRRAQTSVVTIYKICTKFNPLNDFVW